MHQGEPPPQSWCVPAVTGQCHLGRPRPRAAWEGKGQGDYGCLVIFNKNITRGKGREKEVGRDVFPSKRFFFSLLRGPVRDALCCPGIAPSCAFLRNVLEHSSPSFCEAGSMGMDPTSGLAVTSNSNVGLIASQSHRWNEPLPQNPV